MLLAERGLVFISLLRLNYSTFTKRSLQVLDLWALLVDGLVVAASLMLQ